MKSLCEALKNNTIVTHLSLGITNKQNSLLLPSVNTQLQKKNASDYNEIEDEEESFQMFFEFLKSNNTIQSLKICFKDHFFFFSFF